MTNRLPTAAHVGDTPAALGGAGLRGPAGEIGTSASQDAWQVLAGLASDAAPGLSTSAVAGTWSGSGATP